LHAKVEKNVNCVKRVAKKRLKCIAVAAVVAPEAIFHSNGAKWDPTGNHLLLLHIIDVACGNLI